MSALVFDDHIEGVAKVLTTLTPVRAFLTVKDYPTMLPLDFWGMVTANGIVSSTTENVRSSLFHGELALD